MKKEISYKKIKMKLHEIFYSKFNSRKYKNIGEKSYIINPQYLSGRKHISIGDNVWIWDNARIECIRNWNGITFNSSITIGNRCSIGQGLHMTCAEKIVLEKNVVISSYVVITDINHSFDVIDIYPLDAELQTKEVIIGENSLIGSGAKILPGVHIGKNCIVGANAVVTKDIPSYSVVAGVPAKIVKQYDFEKQKWVKV